MLAASSFSSVLLYLHTDSSNTAFSNLSFDFFSTQTQRRLISKVKKYQKVDAACWKNAHSCSLTSTNDPPIAKTKPTCRVLQRVAIHVVFLPRCGVNLRTASNLITWLRPSREFVSYDDETRSFFLRVVKNKKRHERLYAECKPQNLRDVITCLAIIKRNESRCHNRCLNCSQKTKDLTTRNCQLFFFYRSSRLLLYLRVSLLARWRSGAAAFFVSGTSSPRISKSLPSRLWIFVVRVLVLMNVITEETVPLSFNLTRNLHHAISRCDANSII